MMKTNVGLKLWRLAKALQHNCEGQDLIEYALAAGFVVVSVVTLTPEIADSFNTIMSKVNSVVTVSSSS